MFLRLVPRQGSSIVVRCPPWDSQGYPANRSSSAGHLRRNRDAQEYVGGSYAFGRFALSSFVPSGDSDEAEADRDAGAA